MVNYAVQLENGQRGEWADHYIDYKRLKKLITLVAGDLPASSSDSAIAGLMKKLVAPASAARQPGETPSGSLAGSRVGSRVNLSKLDTADADGGLRAPLLPNRFDTLPEEAALTDDALFVTALRAQRIKVQAFYLSEVQRCRGQIEHIVEGMAQRVSKTSPAADPEGAGSAPVGKATQSSLTRAATGMYRTLQHVRNFSILNYTGLLKAAKKHDKAVAAPARVLGWWKHELDQQPFVRCLEVDALCETLEGAYAAAFHDGSVMMARSTLLARQDRTSSWAIADLGLRGGFALTLFAWLIWDLTVDPRVLRLSPNTQSAKWMQTQLPVYRAALALVAANYMWAAALHLWNKHRINFEYVVFQHHPPSFTGLISAARRAPLIFWPGTCSRWTRSGR